MGGCAAYNCSNHSRKKHRMFKFPKDPVRRKIWTINCRRGRLGTGNDLWEPGPSAQLCSEHFEENQFEQNRADNWKKLKQTAVPTLFDIPNAPKRIGPMRVKGIGRPKAGTLLHARKNVKQDPEKEALKKKISELEAEIEKLKEQLKMKEQCTHFLTEEQKKIASMSKSAISAWSHEGILQGLRLRFALGKFGYNFLRDTGYPCPSYSTLNRRIQHVKMNFGVLQPISVLKAKVDTLEENDRWCSIIVDEMEISKNKDFDASKKCFVRNVTLGAELAVGNHYTVVLLRGIKSPWKQVIAHEITGPSTDGKSMKSLIIDTMAACHSVGLRVKAIVSDMGSNNQAMWNALGIKVSKNDRKPFFVTPEQEKVINCVTDKFFRYVMLDLYYKIVHNFIICMLIEV